MNVRVTQNATTRKYISSMNKNLGQMNDYHTKITAQRKLFRASEDSISAARAYVVRRSLANVSDHQSSLKTATNIFSNAESALLTVFSEITTVTTKIVEGVNGDKSQTERNIIASEIENVAKDMITQMNSQYADRRIFGGTNNSSAAFEYNSSTGKVTYNGVDVNTLSSPKDFPGSSSILIDVGLGIEYDASGNPKESTAFDISFNGAEYTGCGVDSDGDSLNVIQLAFDAAKALRDGDTNKATRLLDKVNDAETTLLVGVTKLGVKEKAIEYNQSRLETDELNLKSSQTELEGMTTEDLAETITYYKLVESAYNATLQMGASVVPTSLFNFIK
jgi:flagellar hook-associated protein 3 FlgL